MFQYRDPAELRAHRKPPLAQEHSQTSVMAARAVEPHRGRLQTVVLENIQSAGDWGSTDEEGINRTGIPASTYRPRRIELFEANLIVESGRKRFTKSHRLAVVWRVR